MNAEEKSIRDKIIQAKQKLEELQRQKQQTLTDVERLAVTKKVLEGDTPKRD